MTSKERAIQAIESLPEDATLDDIIETLRDLDSETPVQSSAEQAPPLSEPGLWDLLERAVGTVEMPADWASEHEHYLYGTPKRPPA